MKGEQLWAKDAICIFRAMRTKQERMELQTLDNEKQGVLRELLILE